MGKSFHCLAVSVLVSLSLSLSLSLSRWGSSALANRASETALIFFCFYFFSLSSLNGKPSFCRIKCAGTVTVSRARTRERERMERTRHVPHDTIKTKYLIFIPKGFWLSLSLSSLFFFFRLWFSFLGLFPETQCEMSKRWGRKHWIRNPCRYRILVWIGRRAEEGGRKETAPRREKG